MLHEIEEIYELYLDLKLSKASCRRFVKPCSCLRRWNDEKSRLRKHLDPEVTSKKVSTVKIATNLNKLYSQVNSQLSFLAKCYVTDSIYTASLAEENAKNEDYKIALMVASISLLSNFLITYSSIINLKYVMDHYKAHESKFRMCMDYLMLTCFGILTTVLPMQLLDIVRVAVNTLAIFVTPCWPESIEWVSGMFDMVN